MPQPTRQTSRTVALTISCGGLTCASTAGVFCEHLGSINFGCVPVCLLFPSDGGSYTALDDIDGWAARCQACLAAERCAADLWERGVDQ